MTVARALGLGFSLRIYKGWWLVYMGTKQLTMRPDAVSALRALTKLAETVA